MCVRVNDFFPFLITTNIHRLPAHISQMMRRVRISNAMQKCAAVAAVAV